MLYRGVESFTIYLISISVSVAVIKDCSTSYLKALVLNQAYMLLKLRNNYYIVLICSFGSKTVIFKSNSLSINKKKHIKGLLLNKTTDFVKTEI